MEERVSADKMHKVEIRQRSDGLLQVVLLRWIDEVVPDYGRVASFWSEVHTSATIVQSLEEARIIANELLRASGSANAEQP